MTKIETGKKQERSMEDASEAQNHPEFDPGDYLARLAKYYHIGFRLVLGSDLQIDGPRDIILAATPFIAPRKAEIVDWISRNSPPVPVPYVRKEPTAPRRPSRDFSRCCVCGNPTQVIGGDWEECQHPFCRRHIPVACYPPPLDRIWREVLALFPESDIADAQVEVMERLSIIHDGEDCACFHPSEPTEPTAVALPPPRHGQNSPSVDYPTDPEQEKPATPVYPEIPEEAIT